MDVVLYRHLLIFGTVMKSRPPEVKQAMVQRFAQQWLPALAAGVIRPVIDRVYSFEEIPAAIGYVGERHARGKVVIALQGEA